ncbi:glycosyltransferase family 2 protein [Capnocytophaga sputigena]|jgi:wffH|uniref:glycosyltransferase family 2 protein n=1 Tax=Capnocytophaga sputigena TaxID=1019 RepID=UPI00248DAC1E|nr:glycosyltransferase family A protein [Capnocytophaga sputigena]
MKEKISVLIPTYNVGKFVEKAIRSVMQQSYTNLEIIVVDDFSTDDTFSILQKLANEDSRIKLFRNKQNMKIAATLNFAIEQASGKYIARIDGDDIADNTRIETLYNYLQEHLEVKLVSSNLFSINEKDAILKEEIYPESFESIKKVALFSSPVSHHWLTYKYIYEKYGNYRMSGAEDYDFILRLISNNVPLANVQKGLYYLRIREGNTISTMGLSQIKLSNYAKKLHKERVKNNTLTDSYSLEALKKYLTTSPFITKMHNISASLFRKFVLRKKREGIIYLPLAILFSPYYQLQHIKNKLLYKIYKK